VDLLKLVVRMLAGVVLVCITPPLVIGFSTLIFKLTGRLDDGGFVFYEMRTPAYPGLLTFLGIYNAIFIGLLYLRRILGAGKGPRDSRSPI